MPRDTPSLEVRVAYEYSMSTAEQPRLELLFVSSARHVWQ